MKADMRLWQLCPKCNGERMIHPFPAKSAELVICDVCNGKSIISSLDGLPPDGRVVKIGEMLHIQTESDKNRDAKGWFD